MRPPRRCRAPHSSPLCIVLDRSPAEPPSPLAEVNLIECGVLGTDQLPIGGVAKLVVYGKGVSATYASSLAAEANSDALTVQHRAISTKKSKKSSDKTAVCVAGGGLNHPLRRLRGPGACPAAHRWVLLRRTPRPVHVALRARRGHSTRGS